MASTTLVRSVAAVLVVLFSGQLPLAAEQNCAETASSVATRHAALELLRNQLQQIRTQFPGDMSVYMKNLTTGDEIALDGDSVYETFSVIKLAIAAELLRQVEAGKISLTDRITTKPAVRCLCHRQPGARGSQTLASSAAPS